jgi:hypothetical protein
MTAEKNISVAHQACFQGVLGDFYSEVKWRVCEADRLSPSST